MTARKTTPRATKLASGVRLDKINQIRRDHEQSHRSGSLDAPAVAEPEIHREILFLSNSNRNLEVTIDALCERLSPVLRSNNTASDSEAESPCESVVGHRIREERTAVNVSTQRLSDLISRLAV